MKDTHPHTGSGALPPSVKMQTYRQRMRDAGLRPVQIWVPDTRSAHLQEEARRQSLQVSAHATTAEREIDQFIEDAADW